MFEVILQLAEHVSLLGLSGFLTTALRGLVSLSNGETGAHNGQLFGQEPLFEPKPFKSHILLYDSTFLLDILK